MGCIRKPRHREDRLVKVVRGDIARSRNFLKLSTCQFIDSKGDVVCSILSFVRDNSDAVNVDRYSWLPMVSNDLKITATEDRNVPSNVIEACFICPANFPSVS